MTYEEINERYRDAVLEDAAAERDDDAAGNELAYRNVSEDEGSDETPGEAA